MAELLDDDAEAFLASFDRPRSRGLRLDPAKVSRSELVALLGPEWRFEPEPVPWCPHGVELSPDAGPGLGRHPAHLAGLFYLQEPSSMAAVTALAPGRGWRVIDLAAAPGGKTTQLASLVGPSGLVVANEAVPGRLQALHHNLDRWGAANVVTTSAPVEAIEAPAGGFDGVLLDAPCSGEALFRRDPLAARHWSPAAVQGAARRQAELLAAAARLVRPGGILVYSTCTFNRAENEDRLAALAGAGGVGADVWELEDLSWLGGIPAWPTPGPVPTERAARFWPHLGPGEGQFVARLRRRDDTVLPAGHRSRHGARSGAGPRAPRPELLAAWHEFRQDALTGEPAGDDRLAEWRDWLFAVPIAAAGFEAVGPQRPGLPLGRLRPGRFEPHPALAVSLSPDQVRAPVRWTDDDPALAAYLRGETVPHPGPDGWVLVCYHRWAVGWARRRGGVLKNAFPRHLRRQAAGLPTRARER